MDGKKSEQGIVVNKLIGKATKVSDFSFLIGETSTDSKGSDLMRSPSAHVRKVDALVSSPCAE